MTRYNYFYEGLYGGDAVGRLSPGTPRPAGTPVMDYEGRGFNKLLSSQTYYPGEPDRTDVVVYEYGKLWKEQFWGDTAGDVTSKVETTWRRTDDGKWNRKYEKVTDYGYDRGKLHRIDSTWTDVCPEYCDGVCDDNCEAFTLAERAEYHLYDIFGRRIAHNVCHDPSLEESESKLFEWCKSELVHFDYAGMSNQVIAERRDPYIFDEDAPGGGTARWLVGDRYVSTYTYGPLGLIMRTAELSDSDPTNNRNHYYLSDVMGGNIGLYVDDDGDPGTERQAVFQQFDAFGNDMSKPLSLTSSFAWRGQEGSVTDRASGLVYMQARHYDPSIGRFIQADVLPVASLTTQGMNRYIYCENDPVNKTDPAGTGVLDVLAGLALIAAGIATIVLVWKSLAVASITTWFASASWAGMLLAGILTGVALILRGLSLLPGWSEEQRCALRTDADALFMWAGLLAMGSIGVQGAAIGALTQLTAGFSEFLWGYMMLYGLDE